MSKPKLILLSLIAVIFLFTIFYVIPGLLPGIFVYIPGGEQYYPVDPQAKYYAGQVISGDEASGFIDIAWNDSIFRNSLSDVMWRTGVNYTIGSVIADRYLEKTHFNSYDLLHPHYYKVLPAVEYVFGGIWDQGVNMYVFVDPDKSRVAYIGYIVRYGIENGNYTFESGIEGVMLFGTHNNLIPVYTFFNATIIDNGYNPSYNMSREQEDELIAIAMNDSRVSDLLRGRSYVADVSTVSSSQSFSGQQYSYKICFPGVSFMTSDTGNASFIMSVEIDPLNKTVTYINGFDE